MLCKIIAANIDFRYVAQTVIILRMKIRHAE